MAAVNATRPILPVNGGVRHVNVLTNLGEAGYRVGDTDDCCINGGFVSDVGDFDIFSYDLYQHLKASAPEFEQLAAVQAGQPHVQEYDVWPAYVERAPAYPERYYTPDRYYAQERDYAVEYAPRPPLPVPYRARARCDDGYGRWAYCD